MLKCLVWHTRIEHPERVQVVGANALFFVSPSAATMVSRPASARSGLRYEKRTTIRSGRRCRPLRDPLLPVAACSSHAATSCSWCSSLKASCSTSARGCEPAPGCCWEPSFVKLEAHMESGLRPSGLSFAFAPSFHEAGPHGSIRSCAAAANHA